MIEEKIREYVSKIDARLDIILSESGQHYDEVVRAGRYSLLNGGKRIRPILLLEFYKLCNYINTTCCGISHKDNSQRKT